ncbi:MAG: potassium channel family protein [Thiohalomonadales bacterium]
MKHLSKNNNFFYLAAALIFLLLASSVVDQFTGGYGQRLVQGVIVFCLLIALWSLKLQGSWMRAGLFVIVLLISIVIGSYLLDVAGLDYLNLLTMLIFFVATTYLAARQVLFTGSIDGNKIIGSICIYLLMGLIWAILYLLILEVDASAFHGISSAPWYENFPDVAYYSFVTLTTLGYGDISPTLPVARFLVYMEAIVGVFYMAVLVASLIGVRMSEHKSK